MGQINIRQFTLLVIMLIIGTNILFVPSSLIGTAKQDGWLAGLLGLGMGILLAYFLSIMMQRFGDLSMIQFMLKMLGPFWGILLAIVYLLYLFILSILVASDMGTFIVTQIMTETPIWVIYIIMILVVLLAASYGIESIARTIEMVSPVTILLILLMFILLLPHVQGDQVLPVLDQGIKPVLYATLNFYAFPFNDLVVLMMLSPFVHDKEKVGKAMIVGTAIGGVVLILIALFSLLVLGPEFTAISTFPTYMLAQKIIIGEYLTRIEVAIGITWMLSVFFKLTLAMYAFFLGISQLFKLQRIETASLPLSILLVTMIPIAVPSIAYLLNFSRNYWWPYVITMGTVLPLLLYGIAHLKSKQV